MGTDNTFSKCSRQQDNNKMGKNKPRKRKQRHAPVTSIQTSTRKKKSNRVIAEVHKVNKDIEAVVHNNTLTKPQKAQHLAHLSNQMEELGGINVYQKLSKGAEKHYGNYNTSLWVVEQLHSKGIMPAEKEKAITLLDVGALDLNYVKYKERIQCCAIDLNPQKPEILQANFLTFENPNEEPFDVVVLSLVINFEGDLSKRGQMLKKAVSISKMDGHIFIMLPRACLQNSRYMTSELLDEMMSSLACKLVVSNETKKLSLRMYEKTDSPGSQTQFLKCEVRGGANRNNFCIVLKTK